MDSVNRPAWVQWAKMHGWGPLLSAALDAFEPLAPVGAQLLWTAQPVVRLFGAEASVSALAGVLEAEGGIDVLRGWLDDPVPPEADSDSVVQRR